MKECLIGFIISYMDRRRKLFVGTGLLLVLWLTFFAGVVGGVVGYFVAGRFPLNNPLTTVTTSSGKTLQVTNEESAVINVVDAASPAVVSILAKGIDPFSGNLATQSAGTGFIVRGDGVVVTNSHVVSDTSSTYTVITKDKKTYPATKISRDPSNDVAVLRIEGTNFPTIKLGDSAAIKVGQSVVAIGNALGKFDNTVTSGVVSGTGRGITASDQLGQGSETLSGLIQTDAAINPGNSGGPLLNLAGEVIGINTAAASGAQNLGFAIPANTIKTILDNYLQNGKIVRAFLGVGTQTVTPDLAQTLSLPQGAYVQQIVAGSPADKAGIQRGDVITQFAGTDINESNTLAKVITGHKVGEVVAVKLWRGGNSLTVQVTLTEAP